MLYYKIFPACRPDLYLTLNPTDDQNSAVLKAPLAGRDEDRQLWTPLETFSGVGNKEFVLLNKYNNKVLAARGERQTVTQISLSEIPKHFATWSYLPVAKWNVFGGIQLNADRAMNLNAFGDTWGEDTKVGIHDWKNGAPNEVWQFALVQA